MQLVEAHIAAQQRLRKLLARLVGTAWGVLPGYDEDNVEQWLSWVVPLAIAGTRQSAALTDAYLARVLDRQPLGLEVPYPRPVTATEVYRRPFVTVWTALQAGTEWAEAVQSGRARAESTAAMDVQMASRATFAEAQAREPTIRGYQRVADSGACTFCQLVDGAFVKSADAMPLHPNCGCSLEPVEDELDVTPLPDGVAVHEHGELGPTLADPAHDFLTESQI